MRHTFFLLAAVVAITTLFGCTVDAACPDITAYRTDRVKKMETKKLAGLWYELAYKVGVGP